MSIVSEVQSGGEDDARLGREAWTCIGVLLTNIAALAGFVAWLMA